MTRTPHGGDEAQGMRRLAALPVLTLATALGVAPAGASHRGPVTESWEVTAPLPYPVEGTSHCADGPEGLSKGSRVVVLPDAGTLVVELSGFLGDWVVELFDDKGKLLAAGAELNPTETAPVRKATYKKGKRGAKITVVACNLGGGPTGSLTSTFTHR